MSVPKTIRAGDTLSFQYESADYLPPTWALTLNIVNSEHHYSIASTDGGGVHQFDRTPAQSALFSAGEYRYHLAASDGTDRHIIESGEIKLLLDPASGPMDDRSTIKVILDALDAVLKRKATEDQLSYKIAGYEISKLTPEQIITWHEKYTRMYKQEQRNADREAGNFPSNKIKVRFR